MDEVANRVAARVVYGSDEWSAGQRIGSQCTCDLSGRPWVLRSRVLWRRDPNTELGCACGDGVEVHSVLQHGAVLADARCAANWLLRAADWSRCVTGSCRWGKRKAASVGAVASAHAQAVGLPILPVGQMAPATDIAKYRQRYESGWDAVRQSRWDRIEQMGFMVGKHRELESEIGPPYPFPAAIQQLGPGEVNRELKWSGLTAEQKSFQSAKMAIHAAMVDRMDQEIGRVIAQLKAMNAFEDTLILFLSDNGASAEIMIRGDGHRADAPLGSSETYLCLGPGWSSAANTPFRRHKTWVHEGGISTPLIAHWPKAIKEGGGLRRGVGHVIDIAPTIVELAGGTWPKEVDGMPVPAPAGRSFANSLSDADANSDVSQRSLWWLHEGNRALRAGDWKAVATKGSEWELYNLAEDRTETNNLAETLPEKLGELVAEWELMTTEFTSLRKADLKEAIGNR